MVHYIFECQLAAASDIRYLSIRFRRNRADSRSHKGTVGTAAYGANRPKTKCTPQICELAPLTLKFSDAYFFIKKQKTKTKTKVESHFPCSTELILGVSKNCRRLEAVAYGRDDSADIVDVL